MIEINGRQFCENCFERMTGTGSVCPACGFNPTDSARDPSLLTPGSVLQNRYVVGQVIGKGGFGVTYLAYDALVGKKIAVKEYFPYGLATRTSGNVNVSVTSEENAESFKLGAEKFYNEAKLVMRFNGNPNIVAVYDCFYENATAYIVMEYLCGKSLKEYIRENGTLAASRALYAAKSIANALVVAHSASILHRDITPDNVILCDNGDVKLIDFGAARQVVAEHSQSFSVVLKPGFAPPEQYSKKGNQGPWTDVYAVGTTLYFMLTGDIPEDPSVRFDDDDTFKENLFDIEPTLWGVITKATKLKLEERYPDAYELKKALDGVPIAPEPIIIRDEPLSDSAEASAAENPESITNKTVSINTMRPKKNFWRTHLRTIIEVVGVAAALALIIPLAVKVNKLATVSPNTSNESTISDTSSVGDDTSGISDDTSGAVAVIGNKPEVGSNNTHKEMQYSVLTGNDKDLYNTLYFGIMKGEKTIALPSLTYTPPEIAEIMECVLTDTPLLVNTRGYSLNYNDTNNNQEPDDDEYVNAVVPMYNGTDLKEYNDFITEQVLALDAVSFEEKVEGLKYFHDKLLRETELVQRNARVNSSNAYGAIVEHTADTLGLSMAMCDYAQRLGFDSFVSDRDELFPSLPHPIVHVKIDGRWYFISVYMDKALTISSDEAEYFDEKGDTIQHCFFLASDESSFDPEVLVVNVDEKYLPLWTPDEGTELKNLFWYFEDFLGEKFYYDVDEAYAALLEQAEQSKELSVYSGITWVEMLLPKMEESFLSDLAAKGITASGYTTKYDGDKLTVTLLP